MMQTLAWKFPSYKRFLTGDRRRSLIQGILLLLSAFALNFYSAVYSIRSLGNWSGDIFLDNLPIVNMNPVIVEGAIFVVLGSVLLVLLRPSHLIFTMKAVALFIATRAFFVAVTHLGIYPGQITPGLGLFDQMYLALNLQAGFFFSAHTGLPFLMGLVFWKDKYLRYFYFGLSFAFGVSVLLSHVHYSIDVFAAPFMTYSIFKIAEYLFPEDHALIGAKL